MCNCKISTTNSLLRELNTLLNATYSLSNQSEGIALRKALVQILKREGYVF